MFLSGTCSIERFRFSPKLAVTDVDGQTYNLSVWATLCTTHPKLVLFINTIHSFSTDAETYSVIEETSHVLRNGNADAQRCNAVTDFSPNIVLVVFP